jgi:hypothetical protein
MKAKKEYIILIAIIIALGLYLILRSPDRTQYELPQLPSIDIAKITKIEIAKAHTSITLKKEGDKWEFEPQGYPADTDRVKRMLETIQELTVTALVSESKSYGRYDLEDDKKITVKAWVGDKPTREFDLGKAASSFRHTFVKLAGDDRIYHARGNFRGQFDLSVDNLRDKAVLSFDQAEIDEIHITKGTKEVTFARTQMPVEVTASQDEGETEGAPAPDVEMIWQTADGKKGDKTKLNRFISTLASLRCEKYIDDKKKEDFTNPTYTIKLKDTQEYALSIFAKTDEEAKNYPAISSGNDYPFLLPEWQVNNLMKKPEELLKEPESEKS